MEIVLKNIGRRFNRDWIFKDINYQFHSGNAYAILGRNGSGKSTLLHVLISQLSPSKGTITYSREGKIVDIDHLYKHFSLAAPYMELIEEFTLKELIDFHFSFKNYLNGINYRHFMDILGLISSENKEIRYFSSGMKQRTKLALAVLSDTPMLFLDEPTANLDQAGINWYKSFLKEYRGDRLVVICSNQAHEYEFCDQQLNIEQYK